MQLFIVVYVSEKFFINVFSFVGMASLHFEKLAY